ncbi:MAG: hypothetical protein HC828_04475 [Blastochloris sp.]|nr:hypothetical protein [Blastochloris sp.]
MQITYELTPQNLTAVLQLLTFRSTTKPIRYSLERIVIAIVFGIASAVLFRNMDSTPTPEEAPALIVIGGVLMLVTFVVYPWITRRNVTLHIQSALKQGAYDGLIGHHCIRLEPEQFIHIHEQLEVRAPWEQIKRAEVYEGYVLIWGQKAQDLLVIIPEGAFSSKLDMLAFQQAIQSQV